MTVTLDCRDLRKIYSAESGYALGSEREGVSIEVEQGELFALLGPSGCGKTTTLRIIGGFIDATSGTVEINGEDVTRDPPHRRPTNTVFQSYALFPHMSVGGNVAFGLSMEGVQRKERDRRVSEALELVGLPDMEKRRVTELSGGQAQRAALARAIVKRPVVLLLDEPLGALDLRLRRQMQDELARLKGTIGTTFIHVTHDQEEACAIADRVAVMDRGRIVQVDTPVALFRAPRTSYVANFIDAGTIVRGPCRRRADVIEVSGPDLSIMGPSPRWLNGAQSVAAVLPPDRVRLEPRSHDSAKDGADAHVAHGEVQRVVFTGSVFDVYVGVRDGLEIRSVLTVSAAARLGDALTVGAGVKVSWAPEDVMFVEDVHEAAAEVEREPPGVVP